MSGTGFGFAHDSSYAAHDDQNSIVCNTIEVDGGWRVEVLLPATVSADDAQKMFQWLDSYAQEIRRLHPYWLLSLRGTDRGYALDIERAENPWEFVGKALPFLQRQQQLGSQHA